MRKRSSKKRLEDHNFQNINQLLKRVKDQRAIKIVKNNSQRKKFANDGYYQAYKELGLKQNFASIKPKYKNQVFNK